MGFLIHVSKIGCVNIPCMDSHYPRPVSCFHPHQMPAVSPGFIRWYTYLLYPTMPLWHCSALGATRAAKRLCPSAGSPFLYCPRLSRNPKVFGLGTTAEIRTDTILHITSIDQGSDSRIWQAEIQFVETVVSFFTLAQRNPRRGFPSADVKDIDSKTCCFNKMKRATLATWQRHAPRSQLLNFSGSSLNLTKCKSSQAKTFLIHWTATIIVVAGEKLFSKGLWHRLRPPA